MNTSESKVMDILKIYSDDDESNKFIGWFVVIKHEGVSKPFIITYSKRKGKKYSVYDIINKRGDTKYKLSFGASKYQHYHDIIGGYDELNHEDERRKQLYYARHGQSNDINSAKFWSNLILWS